jgi:hypothetical protein
MICRRPPARRQAACSTSYGPSSAPLREALAYIEVHLPAHLDKITELYRRTHHVIIDGSPPESSVAAEGRSGKAPLPTMRPLAEIEAEIMRLELEQCAIEDDAEGYAVSDRTAELERHIARSEAHSLDDVAVKLRRLLHSRNEGDVTDWDEQNLNSALRAVTMLARTGKSERPAEGREESDA